MKNINLLFFRQRPCWLSPSAAQGRAPARCLQPCPATRSLPGNHALQPESTYYLAPIKGTRKLGKVYVFTRMDRNHDGQLSRSELPLELVDLRMHFVEADWDRNHRLSPDECRMYNEHTAPQYNPVQSWHDCCFSLIRGLRGRRYGFAHSRTRSRHGTCSDQMQWHLTLLSTAECRLQLGDAAVQAAAVIEAFQLVDLLLAFCAAQVPDTCVPG